MSNFPVGATWECQDKKRHMVGRIKLTRKKGKFEVWVYSSWYIDNSGFEADWTSSYKKARELCRVNGRFKRIKGT